MNHSVFSFLTCSLSCPGDSAPPTCQGFVCGITGGHFKVKPRAAQEFACLWNVAGKWKVMQISDLITSTPLLYPEASSVSLAEECPLFLWQGYHLSLLSLETSPLSCPRVPCFALHKVEQCALSFAADMSNTTQYATQLLLKMYIDHENMTF